MTTSGIDPALEAALNALTHAITESNRAAAEQFRYDREERAQRRAIEANEARREKRVLGQIGALALLTNAAAKALGPGASIMGGLKPGGIFSELGSKIGERFQIVGELQKAALAFGQTYDTIKQRTAAGDVAERFGPQIAIKTAIEALSEGLDSNSKNIMELAAETKAVGGSSQRLLAQLRTLNTVGGLTSDQTEQLAVSLRDTRDRFGISIDNLVESMGSLQQSFMDFNSLGLTDELAGLSLQFQKYGPGGEQILQKAIQAISSADLATLSQLGIREDVASLSKGLNLEGLIAAAQKAELAFQERLDIMSGEEGGFFGLQRTKESLGGDTAQSLAALSKFVRQSKFDPLQTEDRSKIQEQRDIQSDKLWSFLDSKVAEPLNTISSTSLGTIALIGALVNIGTTILAILKFNKATTPLPVPSISPVTVPPAPPPPPPPGGGSTGGGSGSATSFMANQMQMKSMMWLAGIYSASKPIANLLENIKTGTFDVGSILGNLVNLTITVISLLQMSNTINAMRATTAAAGTAATAAGAGVAAIGAGGAAAGAAGGAGLLLGLGPVGWAAIAGVIATGAIGYMMAKSKDDKKTACVVPKEGVLQTNEYLAAVQKSNNDMANKIANSTDNRVVAKLNEIKDTLDLGNNYAKRGLNRPSPNIDQMRGDMGVAFT